jgi:hypothetical protein
LFAHRLEALDEAEEARRVCLACSGMHTKYVRQIIDQICRCGDWVSMPFSCAEYVVPALIQGIPEHWEHTVSAQGEIAVYAALFITLYLGAILGGFRPPNTGEANAMAYPNMNARYKFIVGYNIGVYASLFNILVSVSYRLASSVLLRESDKLVVLWKFRWLPALNALVFVFGCAFGMNFGLGSSISYIMQGDGCMDGSQSYLQWYLEWVRDVYPKGHGMVHPLGVPVVNPWAAAAMIANVTRPDSEYFPNHEGSEHHASFYAFQEFMASYLGHQGTMCFGGEFGIGNSMYSIIVIIGICVPLIYFRNPSFYWFRKPKVDPYDMTAAYDDFLQRAEIGRELAAEDHGHTGLIDPALNRNQQLYSKRASFITTTDADTTEDPECEEIVEIQDPVHRELLQRAMLDFKTLAPFIDNGMLLVKLFESAGIETPGDQLKIMRVLQQKKAVLDEPHPSDETGVAPPQPPSATS